MAKFLDENGLSHFYSLLKSKFNKVDPATANPAMDGTVAVGTSAKYAREDHVHPSDTSRAPTSHASTSTTYGKGTSSNYGHVKLSDSTSSTSGAASGGTAATPMAVSEAKTGAINEAKEYTNTTVTALRSDANPKMDGTAAPGTSTNFSRADHVHPTDTSRAPTSHASTATTYGKGTSSSYGHVKLSDSLAGTETAASGGTAATPKAVADALAQALGADETYSLGDATLTAGGVQIDLYADNTPVSTVSVTSDRFNAYGGCTEMRAGTQGMVPAPAAGQEMSLAWGDGTWQAPFLSASASSGNITLSLMGASQTAATLPTTGTITASNIVTAIGNTAVNRATADASGNNIASTYATQSYVTNAISSAMAGAASFKGSIGSSTSTATYTQSTLEAASYKAGWYLVVNSAGTYVGHACEVGDMVYCVSDKGSAYAASDFTVVQNEMDVLTNTEIDAIVNS